MVGWVSSFVTQGVVGCSSSFVTQGVMGWISSFISQSVVGWISPFIISQWVVRWISSFCNARGGGMDQFICNTSGGQPSCQSGQGPIRKSSETRD